MKSFTNFGIKIIIICDDIFSSVWLPHSLADEDKQKIKII